MLQKKYKKTVAAAIFILILAGFYWVSFGYLTRRIDEEREGIQQAIALQEKKQQRLKELLKIKEDYALVESKQGQLPKVPDEKAVIDFIRSLEKIGESVGAKIEIEVIPEISPTGKENKKAADKGGILEKIPLEKYTKLKVSLGGSYGSILKFIAKLENLNHFFDLVSLSVSKSTEENKTFNSQKASVTFPEGNPLDGEKKVALPEIELLATLEILVYKQ
jgi:hypothetical protein